MGEAERDYAYTHTFLLQMSCAGGTSRDDTRPSSTSLGLKGHQYSRRGMGVVLWVGLNVILQVVDQ